MVNLEGPLKKFRRLVIATPPLAGEAILLYMDQWVGDYFVVHTDSSQ